MRRYIYFREVISILSNKKIRGVDIPTATARIRSILMETEGFNYDFKKNIQKNIMDFYAERGYPELCDISRRFANHYTEETAERDIQRIIDRHKAPACMEIKIRNSNPNATPQVNPVPVVWKKTDYGTENAFCAICGKRLYSTISLLSPSIRGYNECDCRKSS